MEYCGSRTEKCEICSNYIQAKDKQRHDMSNCQFPEQKQKPKEVKPTRRMVNEQYLTNSRSMINIDEHQYREHFNRPDESRLRKKGSKYFLLIEYFFFNFFNRFNHKRKISFVRK